jgi:CheY-like chemotaxis protein
MNSQSHSVLIVDANEAFATMLKESLEQEGEYRATVATNGDEALGALAATEPDLAVVDLGLDDPDGAVLVRLLRRESPDLRLMLIPLEGEDLPPQLADLGVQGVLPKPFFLPDLLGHVGAALGLPESVSPGVAETTEPDMASEQPVRPAVSTTERPAVSTAERQAMLREHLERVVERMNVLCQEINAEAVILTCGGKLLAHTGRLPAEAADKLAQVADESWRASARVARILGQEPVRFEQSVEGGEYMFYSLAVAEDVILSAALGASVPLGLMRHRAKATADALQALVG